jgi:hypothetical protein
MNGKQSTETIKIEAVKPFGLVIEASKLLMNKASSEICDIELKDSI